MLKSIFKSIKIIRLLLQSSDFEEKLKGTDIASEKMINPLLGCLFETDETIRWRAVRAVGITVAAMAEKDMEAARTIMRRLIWSLNDESGGIGWGTPEAMGEIMAENETLACEYYRILVSFIDENGNLLENDELERGAMWGIDRLAQKRPELLREWTGPLLAQLKSPDRVKRGLALRGLLFLAPSWGNPAKRRTGTKGPGTGKRAGRGPDTEGPCSLPDGLEPGRLAALLTPLLEDRSKIRVFQDGSFAEYKICGLASELFERLKHSDRKE